MGIAERPAALRTCLGTGGNQGVQNKRGRSQVLSRPFRLWIQLLLKQVLEFCSRTSSPAPELFNPIKSLLSSVSITCNQELWSQDSSVCAKKFFTLINDAATNTFTHKITSDESHFLAIFLQESLGTRTSHCQAPTDILQTVSSRLAGIGAPHPHSPTMYTTAM